MINRLKNIIGIAILAATALTACSDKEDTTPSYADKDRMEALLDRSIPAMAETADKYGTYMLYNFDKSIDFAYQFQEATTWESAQVGMLCRDSAALAAEYLCANVFDKYTEDFKKKQLPRKLLLTDYIKSPNELGISTADAEGYHIAVANINSMSVAFNRVKLNAGDISKSNPLTDTEFQHAVHKALLAAYMVKSKHNYPVSDEFLSQSRNYYSSLMTTDRKQAAKLPNDFFLTRGFFRPSQSDATYFPSAEDDMVAYITNLVEMDSVRSDTLSDYPLIENKLHYLAVSLKNMGVDLAAINPASGYYLSDLSYRMLPTVTVSPISTTSNKADINFVLTRGSKPLDRAEVFVNDTLRSTLTIDAPEDQMRIPIRIPALECFYNDSNKVEVKVYEQNRKKPSAVQAIQVYRLNSVMLLRMVNSDGNKFDMYEYDYDWTETTPGTDDIRCVRFKKHATWVDYNTGEDDQLQRFWIMKKENGRVTQLIVKQEFIFLSVDEPIRQEFHTKAIYNFAYNDLGELTSVTKDNAPYVTDVKYADGLITSYKISGKLYKPAYDYNATPAVRIDCLDESLSGHKFVFKGNESPNYYYVPELPAVIPGTEADGVPLQILYSRYLFTALNDANGNPVWSNKWIIDEEQGTHWTEVSIGEQTSTFSFKLQSK